MSNTAESSPQQEVTRIGIVLGPFKRLNVTALQYCVLRMNSLQHWFEYEFLPGFELLQDEPQAEYLKVPERRQLRREDESLRQFLQTLSRDKLVDRGMVEVEAAEFVDVYESYLWHLNQGYGLKYGGEPPGKHFVFVTEARFHDNYYLTRQPHVSIMALGNWQRGMAPPSILEFILTLLMRLSVAIVCPSLQGPIHLGTKGCLFDFSRNLSEARQQVLQGFICNHCRAALQRHNLENLADDIIPVLDKEWFGRSDDPTSPAGIARNLGYDLFRTKGFEATPTEKFLATMSQEGIKLPFAVSAAVIGAVLTALLFVFLGLPQL